MQVQYKAGRTLLWSLRNSARDQVRNLCISHSLLLVEPVQPRDSRQVPIADSRRNRKEQGLEEEQDGGSMKVQQARSEFGMEDCGVSVRGTASSAPSEVFRELFELLEEYAPAWYTEEHHNRAIAALGSAR